MERAIQIAQCAASAYEDLGVEKFAKSGKTPDPAASFDEDRFAFGKAAIDVEFDNRTRPIVKKTVRRLLGAGDCDFEDIVQIAMMELIRSLKHYRVECTIETWTATVSANVVYKQLRRRGVEQRLFSREIVPEDVPISSKQEPVLREMVDRVMDHLRLIQPERAWAYLLHDVHGYSLEEIARISNATVAAVQSRLFRGRRELHERIAKDPDLAGGLDCLE